MITCIYLTGVSERSNSLAEIRSLFLLFFFFENINEIPPFYDLISICGAVPSQTPFPKVERNLVPLASL